MNGYRFILLAALWATCSLQAVTIVSSFPRFLEDADNTRLAEFVGHGQTDFSTRATIYSDASSRQGFFFVVELSSLIKDLPQGSTALLETYFEGDAKARSQKFELTSVAENPSRALYLGLTAPEYRYEDSLPKILAWKVSLVGADGATLAETHSPLWQY